MKSVAPPHPFDQLLEINRRSRGRVTPAAEALPAPGMSGGLAVRLDDQHLLFSLDAVAEIIPLPRITLVPGVQPWLLGIINLRGTVVSVVDMHGFLHGGRSAPTARSRILVVRAGDWACGLVVDEVFGMRHFVADSRLAVPGGVAAGLRPYIAEVFRGEGQQWLVFSTARLLRDPRFLNAAQ